MNVSATDHFKTSDAVELYGIDGWGNGYLSINEQGHLLVSPDRKREKAIDLHGVVRDLVERGYKTPLLLRFPQLLASQVRLLTLAFSRAIDEYDYPERYYPVFPIKVNQQRAVLEGLLAGGSAHGLGLEVGSRPELMVAAAQPTAPEALIICNGFKDAEYLSAAALTARMGKRVVVVIEKPFEIEPFLELAAREPVVPMIGFRIRLQARGSGLWEKSGGFASKFGLTTGQLLEALSALERAGLQEKVRLMHFHIGSQITEIRKIKSAVLEASRIYAKLRKRGVAIRFLDVGGGLGIDYDGSKTSGDASVNYSVQEYANDVVFGISEVCEQEEVPPPTIVSESGRMMVAYHSILVTDVRCAISGAEVDPPQLAGDESQVIQDLAEVARTITVKNYREYYHDAIEYRDQMYSRFNLGMLGLHERAKGESLFRVIARKAVRFSKSAKFIADEFIELETKLHDKYVCNFSVFQSLPDHWALDQLFPAMPIHRLNEPPTRKASLVDITCDSDGEVEKFVDRREIKSALEVHELIPGQPYYLAFLLIGAYQDTMGDLHNLFGRVHQAEVMHSGDGRAAVRQISPGEPTLDAVRWCGFNEEELVARIDDGLREKVERGLLGEAEHGSLVSDYRARLGCYTYLD